MASPRRRVVGLIALIAVLVSVELIPRLNRVTSPLQWPAQQIERRLYNLTSNFREWAIKALGGTESQRVSELEALLGSSAVDRARLAQLETENAQLKDLVQLRETRAWRSVATTIVGQDPRDPIGLIRIGAGARQGIARGAAVVSSSGVLVGIVVDAREEISSVRLIRSRGMSLLGKIAGKETIIGVVESPDGLALHLNQIPKNSDIKIDDVVVTNIGILGIPPNIPIGGIIRVTGRAEDLWGDALIAPFAPPSTLGVVNVVIQIE